MRQGTLAGHVIEQSVIQRLLQRGRRPHLLTWFADVEASRV
jgi:hypothetical protein